MPILFANRGWVKLRHVNPEIQQSVKHCLSETYLKITFHLCFYFDSHQKGAHLYQRGATRRGSTDVLGGAVATNCCLLVKYQKSGISYKTLIRIEKR